MACCGCCLGWIFEDIRISRNLGFPLHQAGGESTLVRERHAVKSGVIDLIFAVFDNLVVLSGFSTGMDLGLLMFNASKYSRFVGFRFWFAIVRWTAALGVTG